MYYKMNNEKAATRIQKMIDIRNEYLNRVEECHVSIQKGNEKTGEDCYTVSLLPILDCKNCANCMHECYDFRNDCRTTSVIKGRAKNSAIYNTDKRRYWSEIESEVIKKKVRELRINVGGDLVLEDFFFIKGIAERNPQCDILFFTKSYDDINLFLDNTEFPKNVKAIWSRWEGLDGNNKHSLPESHVVYANGNTTAPEYGAYYCGGNCSNCHINKEGCWNLNKKEHVCFLAH